MGNKIKDTETLGYATAFLFPGNAGCMFYLGSTLYRHVDTVYDKISDDTHYITLEIAYNVEKSRHEAINVHDTRIMNKRVTILKHQ